MSLPADLSEDGTLLILLPEYAGDGDVEAALANTPSSEFAAPEEAIVLLFVGDAPGFGKAFAAGQLRARFQSDVLRARILPVYMDLPEFEERASLEPAEENKRTILVNRTGAISIAKRRP